METFSAMELKNASFISFQSSEFFLRIVGLYLKTASCKPGIASLHLTILTFFVRIQNLYFSFLTFPVNV